MQRKGFGAIEGIRIVFAGGGTGGHLFPGIAIAQEFLRRDPNAQVLFIGTGKPIEISVLSEHGFPHKQISSEGIKGRTWWQKVRSIFKLPIGLLASIYILWRFHPNMVVGLGGYSAASVVAAAWLLRMNIILQEQNTLPGITNRLLAPLADRIYVSFQQTETYFKRNKIRLTGNPIRNELMAPAGKMHQFDGESGPFTVLILGGSQGAHRINVAVTEALSHLREKDRFYFIHQTGTQDENFVTDSYRKQDVSAEVGAFFKDMATPLQKADVVVCRAGATTVAEITAMGLAAIFIPFPYAADNHQVLNARELEAEGAAEVILESELNGQLLAQRIAHYASNPEAIRQMEEKSKSKGNPEAAAAIVDDCYDLIMEKR